MYINGIVKWLSYFFRSTETIVFNQIFRLDILCHCHTISHYTNTYTPTHIMSTHTKYVFLKTRIQSEWKSSLAKQWTKPDFSLCATNMVDIQFEGFFALRQKKCVKILYLNLANLLHTHTHARWKTENKEQTIKRMGKTHTDSYVVLWTILLLLACLLSVYIYRLHWL